MSMVNNLAEAWRMNLKGYTADGAAQTWSELTRSVLRDGGLLLTRFQGANKGPLGDVSFAARSGVKTRVTVVRAHPL